MVNFTTITDIKFSPAKEPQGWGRIDWEALIRLVISPRNSKATTTERAKQTAPLIAAYDKNTRDKATAITGMFGMLRADIDATTETPESLASALCEQGLTAFAIYSTLSHCQAEHRYRVMIPLAEPVPYERWLIGQWYLAEVLPDCDPCAERPAQFMLLPCATKESAADYEHAIETGAALSEGGMFWLNAEEHAKTLADKAKLALNNAVKQPAVKPYRENLIGKQVSIISLLERHIDWPSLLAEYGYKRLGENSWLAPESGSKQAGAHILTSHSDGKQRLYSHHESDPCGGRLVDKLDFIAIRRHSGNQQEALKQVAEQWFMDAHVFNRKEWKASLENQKFQKMRGA